MRSLFILAAGLPLLSGVSQAYEIRLGGVVNDFEQPSVIEVNNPDKGPVLSIDFVLDYQANTEMQLGSTDELLVSLVFGVGTEQSANILIGTTGQDPAFCSGFKAECDYDLGWPSGPMDAVAEGMVTVEVEIDTPLADLIRNGRGEWRVSVWNSSGVDGVAGELLPGSYVRIVQGPGEFAKLLSVNDAGNDGTTDLLMSRLNPDGSVLNQINDTVSTVEASRVFYDRAYPARDVAGVDDVDASGVPEFAVLGRFVAGNSRVELRDRDSGAVVRRIFFNPSYTPQNLMVIPDLNANGSQELAVMSVFDAGSNVRVEIRDADTGEKLRDLWYGDTYVPDAALAVSDLDGNGFDEVAVLGHHPDFDNLRLDVRDSDTRALVSRTWYGSDVVPVDLTTMDDVTANGAAEFALLGENAEGFAIVQVRDSMTGALVRKTWFGNDYRPRALLIVPDLGSDGNPDLVVIGQRDDGFIRGQIKDSVSGAFVGNVWFGNPDDFLSATVVPDVTNNGSAEIAVARAVGNQVEVLVRDAWTGAFISSYMYP